MKVRFINATPHEVVIKPHDGDDDVGITIPESGMVARVRTNIYYVHNAGQVRMYYETLECTELPKPSRGVFYIVSKIYFDASDRTDICHPAVVAGDVDKKGKIRTVPGLIFKNGAIPSNRKLKLRY